MEGQQLRSIRQELGWTQVQLAGALGITVTYVGLMERGMKAIGKRTALAARQLLSEQSGDGGYDGDEPISEAANMFKAIVSAREAVQSYRRSGESLCILAEPSMRSNIIEFAQVLTDLIQEQDQKPIIGPNNGC